MTNETQEPDYEKHQVRVCDFNHPEKTDSEIISDAFSFAALFDTRTMIFDQKDWYIDEAILLPSNTKVVIDGCMIKQNDEVFDNVFRGDNLILNEEDPYGDPISMETISHIVIEGRNGALIVGCDINKRGYHPVMREEQDMVGDFWGWRTLQISLSLADHIEISGLTLKQTRCWALSFDKCTYFYVHDMYVETAVKNGDGINARAGCHHFRIERITGYTSDDTVACTAGRPDGLIYPCDNYLYTMEPSRFLNASMDNRELDIHDGSIADISTGGIGQCVMCAGGEGLRVYNIQINHVHEIERPDERVIDRMYKGYGPERYAAVRLFQGARSERKKEKLVNSVFNIRVSDVVAHSSTYAVRVDIVTENVWLNKIVQRNPDHGLCYIEHKDGITMTNC